jgi:hypothetical protein
MKGSTRLEKIKDILSEQQDTNIKQKPFNIYRGGGQSEFYTSEISASPRYQEPVFL